MAKTGEYTNSYSHSKTGDMMWVYRKKTSTLKQNFILVKGLLPSLPLWRNMQPSSTAENRWWNICMPRETWNDSKLSWWSADTWHQQMHNWHIKIWSYFPLHFLESLTPFWGSFLPKFKIYKNIIYYESYSYYITLLLI